MRIVRAGVDSANRLIHVRKTVTFDGTAGNGAVGTVALFNITGRVGLHDLTIFCSESLEEGGATATMTLGTASGPDFIISTTTATALVANEWWNDTTPTNAGICTTVGSFLSSRPSASESLIITVGAQSVSNGTLVFDLFYKPLTDDGAMVAA